MASLAAGYARVVNVAGMWKVPFWNTHFTGVSVLAQLALSRANLPYSRIQIQAPPGLTVWDARTSIESGIPAPALNGWNNKLTRQVDFLVSNQSYLMREKNLDPSAPNDKAARDQILQDLLQKSPATASAYLKPMRGFYPTGPNTIATRIESQFSA